jgi:hypothetical protein
MKSAQDLLKSIIGEEGYGRLEKAIYRSKTQSVADPMELYLPLLVVPRAILSWLVQNIQPLKVGEYKEFKYPGKENVVMRIEKLSTDVYRGEFIEGGKIIHTFDKQSLPSIGGHFMTVFEQYDHLADQPAPDKSEDPKSAVNSKPEVDTIGDSREVVRTMMYMDGIAGENLSEDSIKWMVSHANIKTLTETVGKLIDALVAKEIKIKKDAEAIESITKEEIKGADQKIKPIQEPEEKAKIDAKKAVDNPSIIDNKEGARSDSFNLEDLECMRENRGAPKLTEIKHEVGKARVVKEEKNPVRPKRLFSQYNKGKTFKQNRQETDIKIKETMTGKKVIDPQALVNAVANLPTKTNKVEMPGGAAMPNAPKKPLEPVKPSNKLKLANKQAQMSAQGKQAKPPASPSMPKQTMSMPKKPSIQKDGYFKNLLSKKKVLEPLIKPAKKSEQTFVVMEPNLYSDCKYCRKPEFQKNEKGEPEFSPCACFTVTNMNKNGQVEKFLKISKSQDGTYKLVFNQNADPDLISTFLKTFKIYAILKKQGL